MIRDFLRRIRTYAVEARERDKQLKQRHAELIASGRADNEAWRVAVQETRKKPEAAKRTKAPYSVDHAYQTWLSATELGSLDNFAVAYRAFNAGWRAARGERN